MLIKNLISSFNNYRIINETDKLAQFNLILKIEALPELDVFHQIIDSLKRYPKRDSVNICFKSSTDDFFNLVTQQGKLSYEGPEYIVNSDSIDNIATNFSRLKVADEEIEIIITIKKDYRDGLISIYSLDKFINWLLEKDIYEMIAFFSNIYKSKDGLIFICYDDDVEVITETFQITNDKQLINKSSICRKNILSSRLEISNVQNLALDVIPEDFNILKYSYKDTSLKHKLDNIRDILAIAHIANMASIQKEFSEFRIDGYKSSDFKIYYGKMQGRGKNNYLYEVYKWVYNEGNLIDKAIIARNIVSLHCRYHSILELDAEILNSIETNYSYYLKTNTDEYLDENKNLRLAIIEEGKLLSEALYEFIGNIGKSLLAYFTFLATLMISTTLANEKFENIFTNEVVQIVALIILGSFLFLIYSNIEASYKKERIEEYIKDLVNGYGVVLGKNNVKKIINEVKSYKNVEKSFHRKKNFLSLLWVVFNLILLLVLDWISGDVKILGIFNILK